MEFVAQPRCVLSVLGLCTKSIHITGQLVFLRSVNNINVSTNAYFMYLAHQV